MPEPALPLTTGRANNHEFVRRSPEMVNVQSDAQLLLVSKFEIKWCVAKPVFLGLKP